MYNYDKLKGLLTTITNVVWEPAPAASREAMDPDYREAMYRARVLIEQLENFALLGISSDTMRRGAWNTIYHAAYMMTAVVLVDKIAELHSRGRFTDEQFDRVTEAVDAADEEQKTAMTQLVAIACGAVANES